MANNRRILAGVILACVTLQTSVFAEEELFQVNLTLLEPITLTQQSALNFPPVVAGVDTTLVTTPESTNAVKFSATGEPLTGVTGSVVEDFIIMTTADGLAEEQQIRVDTFTTGGDIDTNGAGNFDSNGELNNLRLGATAHIEASDEPGLYTSSATFRLLYN